MNKISIETSDGFIFDAPLVTAKAGEDFATSARTALEELLQRIAEAGHDERD